MTTEPIARWRAIFNSLENEPALIGNKLIADGERIDDDIVKAACTHSVAISLKRIANILSMFYHEGVNVNSA